MPKDFNKLNQQYVKTKRQIQKVLLSTKKRGKDKGKKFKFFKNTLLNAQLPNLQ